MKIALLISLLTFGAFAAAVDGTLTYKLPSGDLVDRDVTLEVPSRGQGEVVLSGKNFEWKTTKFRSFERAGKLTFVAAFDTDFRGMKSKTILRGTYLQGKNTIIYTGDMYKVKDKKVSHLGVFNFKYDR